MTLSGKGSKCRVCTHPDRMQNESMLARGTGIAVIRPMMQDAFSRRALYRHRAKHMIAADSRRRGQYRFLTTLVQLSGSNGSNAKRNSPPRWPNNAGI